MAQQGRGAGDVNKAAYGKIILLQQSLMEFFCAVYENVIRREKAMIYITGDCHGDFKRFTAKVRKKQKIRLNTEDYLIVCGGFGLCWARDAEFEYNCKWLGGLPFTILWVQGNHENDDLVEEFPCEISFVSG